MTTSKKTTTKKTTTTKKKATAVKEPTTTQPENDDTEAAIAATQPDPDEVTVDAQEEQEEQLVDAVPGAPVAKPLALKIARVMAQVQHVPKNGRNDFHKYDYVMESDLVDRLRGHLASQGVALLPSIREHVVKAVQDARGKQQFMATVTLDVTFIDSESGDQMTTTWVGQGMDSGDKSYYKAYTGAFKYALLKTFMVTAQNDEEPPSRVRAPSKHQGGRGGRRRA